MAKKGVCGDTRMNKQDKKEIMNLIKYKKMLGGRRMEEVEKVYQEFWKDIVENEDGTLNKEQVKKELADFSMVMDNCSSAYEEMSGSLITKPNTYFSEVLKIFQEKFWNVDFVKDDIRDMLKDTYDIEELKSNLIEYFDLEVE